MRYALYLTFLYGSLPFVFVRPFYGLCVYFIVSFMEPKVLCWQPALQDSMIVGVPLVLGILLFGIKRIRIEPVREALTGRITDLRETVVRNRLIEPAGLLV